MPEPPVPAPGAEGVPLPFGGPLAFTALLAHRAMRCIPGVETAAGGAYRRIVAGNGDDGAGMVTVAYGSAHELTLSATGVTGGGADRLVDRARHLFGLDRPWAAATPLAGDTLIGPLARNLRGLRVPGAWDTFELSVRIILGQQVSVAGASTLTGRLARALGRPVAGFEAFGLSHVFPSAACIADTPPEQLAALTGTPAARARALRAFAAACADGAIPFADGGRDELVATLVALPGIGPWTAEMIALQVAGHGDAFPAGDLGLRASAARMAGRAERISERELAAMAEAWRPQRGLAAMHLWMAGKGGG